MSTDPGAEKHDPWGIVDKSKQREAILSLDFTDIKENLVFADRWSKKKANAAEKWYKNFLILAAKYPGETLVPTEEVDTMWHMHVLETARYADDTRTIFGGFLDHTPTYGKVDLINEFKRTNQLLFEEFGEDVIECFPKNAFTTKFRSCKCNCNPTIADRPR